MEARCKMCDRTIRTMLVGGSEQQMAQALGIEMMAHANKYHKDFLQKLAGLSNLFNGLMLMIKYDISDPGTLMEMESMRDRLCERVMEGAPTEIVEDDDSGSDDDEDEEIGIVPCPHCKKDIDMDLLLDSLEDDDEEDDVEGDEDDEDREDDEEEAVAPTLISEKEKGGEIIDVTHTENK